MPIGDARYFASHNQGLHGIYLYDSDVPTFKITQAPVFQAGSNLGIKKDGAGFYALSGAAVNGTYAPMLNLPYLSDYQANPTLNKRGGGRRCRADLRHRAAARRPAAAGARVDANFDPLVEFPGDIWHYARARIVVAARTAGVDAIDAPFPSYRDPGAYQVACERAAAMGFLGKWAIHPSQVEIANAAFSPAPDEIAHAQRLVAAYRAAESAGKGASGL